MKIYLYILLLFFLPFKNESISTHPTITIKSEYFSITTENVIPELGDIEYEKKMIDKWINKTTPIMKKIGSHLENEIPAIFNELKLQSIPYDSTHVRVWEENIDKNSISHFLKSKESHCRYGMRISNFNVHGDKNDKIDRIQLESEGNVNHLYMEVIFDKNIPEKIVRDSLKVRILNILKTM